MSYHCGIGEGMRAIGYAPREPHIKCDGCGRVYVVKPRGAGGAAPSWFLDGKAPPGWLRTMQGPADDPIRRDYCCKDCEPAHFTPAVAAGKETAGRLDRTCWMCQHSWHASEPAHMCQSYGCACTNTTGGVGA